MAQTIGQNYKQPDRQRKGTGFTNLQRLLQANVGGRLGQTVGSGIAQQAGRAREAIGTAQEQFQEKAGQSRLGTEQQKQQVQSWLQDPTQADQTQQKQFQKYLQGVYRGPTELEGQESLFQRARGAESAGQAVGTKGGRLELLRRFAAPRAQGRQYSLGQQRLDALLLGGDQSGKQALQTGRREALGLGRELSAQTQAAAGRGQQFVEEAQRFGQSTTGQLKTEAERFQEQLEQQRQQAIQEREARIQNVGQQFQRTGQLTEEDIDRLGLRPYLGSQLGKFDVTRFLRQADDEATLQTTASAEDIARMQALQGLSGGLGGDVQQILGTFEGMTPEEAQAYQQSAGYTFDLPAFRRQLELEKAARQGYWYEDRPEVHEFWGLSDAVNAGIANADQQARYKQLYDQIKAGEMAKFGNRTLGIAPAQTVQAT